MLRSGIHLAESEDEKEAVYRFRYDVYVEEMGRYGAAAEEGPELALDEAGYRAGALPRAGEEGLELLAHHRVEDSLFGPPGSVGGRPAREHDTTGTRYGASLENHRGPGLRGSCPTRRCLRRARLRRRALRAKPGSPARDCTSCTRSNSSCDLMASRLDFRFTFAYAAGAPSRSRWWS